MLRSEQGNLSLRLLSLCLGLCLGLLQLHHLLLLSIGGLAGLATLSAIIHDARSIARGVRVFGISRSIRASASLSPTELNWVIKLGRAGLSEVIDRQVSPLQSRNVIKRGVFRESMLSSVKGMFTKC